jgi:mitochondrial fission protein ELM1
MIDNMSREGPLLVVACGRDTISTASSIKRLASQNVFVVQVCRFNAYLLLSNFALISCKLSNFYCMHKNSGQQITGNTKVLKMYDSS